MKKVYVTTVQWYEDGKWYNTNLYVFSNRKAAQGYIDAKNAKEVDKPFLQKSFYKIEEYPVMSKNHLAE